MDTVYAENIRAHNVVKVNILTMSNKREAGSAQDTGFIITQGTGFVINDEGYIVTNWHVVTGAVAIFVLKDGQRVDALQGFDIKNKFEGANIERDPWTSQGLDLAILKVKPEYWTQLNLMPVTLTNQLPKQGSLVSVQGYPGIAEATAVESVDVTASSTFASGSLARIIEDGKWSRGKQTLVQLLHTAPTSDGNSGGPIFDECNRVVGVHSASPIEKSTMRDKKGNTHVTGYVSNAAYGIASDISELITVLDRKQIKYFLNESICYSKQELYKRENEKLSKTLQITLYFGGAALIFIGLMFIYLMRKPKMRQKFNHAIETYSRSLRSPSASVQNSTVKATSPQSANSQTALILDGFGLDKHRYRLAINSDSFNQGEIEVGRKPSDPAYTINDESVSRKHCIFYAQENVLFIREINSTNGTFVNGRRLAAGESISLSNGADIKLGSVTFKVIFG